MASLRNESHTTQVAIDMVIFINLLFKPIFICCSFLISELNFYYVEHKIYIYFCFHLLTKLMNETFQFKETSIIR